MKKIKVTWNGEPLREIYPHATRFQVFKYKLRKFVHKVMIVTMGVMGISFVGLTSFSLGASFATPNTISVDGNSTSTPVYQALPPILQRIAQCESTNSQIDSTGQVVMHANKNGTVDVGKYQINSIWFKQATELNYDLTKPADNLAFAEWLYANKGTGAWQDSSGCWNK